MRSDSAENVLLDFGIELTSASLESCLTHAKIALAAKNTETIDPAAIVVNLSSVRWINIDSLLFLLCVLGRLKADSTQLTIILPEYEGKWLFNKTDPPECIAVRKVRDYLKRWRFSEALREAVGPLEEVLPSHQERYFDDEAIFYRPATHFNEKGDKYELLSTLLLEITHMTRGDAGNRHVSRDVIKQFLQDFSVKGRLKWAVSKAVDRERDLYFAKEFAQTLLWESLINTAEHPNATMSVLSVARSSDDQTFVIAIADNGDPIPNTIAESFDDVRETRQELYPDSLSQNDLRIASRIDATDKAASSITTYRENAAATRYATESGTTSLKGQPRSLIGQEIFDMEPEEADNFARGLGLFYVKERTIEFGGTLTIRAGGSEVQFSPDSTKPEGMSTSSRLVSKWPGNLLSICLPILVH